MDLSSFPCATPAPLKFMASAEGGWPIPVGFLDVNSYPVDLTAGSLTPVVLFYQPGRVPMPLVFTPTQAQVGIGVATVPEVIARATIQGGTNPGLLGGLLAAIGPAPVCRAYAYCLDSLGNATSGQVLEILPVDWRTADAGDLPPVPTSYVTVGPAGAKGDKGDQGIQGLPGGVTPLTGLAAGPVAQYQVVRSPASAMTVANSADATQAGTVIGIATQAGSTGQATTYQDNGTITNAAWNWATGPIYFDNNATLTQTPPTGGFSQTVGLMQTKTTISVRLAEPEVIEP